MPYIDQTGKDYLDGGGTPTRLGDLTYLISMALIKQDKQVLPTKSLFTAVQAAVDSYLGRLDRNPRYVDYAEVLGCLDSARREHVRRTGYAGRVAALALADFQNRYYNEVVAPYEDAAIAKNGDVY